VAVTIGSGASTGRLATTNVGLSFEASDLADPRWEPGASSLTTLVKALDKPSLRFGGNSVDRRVWWTSTGEAPPAWAEETLTPADLDRLGRFATATDATVTMVANLGHYDPERAADYAWHARRSLGPRLVGLSVGNEPNGFNLASQPQYKIRDDTWGPAAFITQLTAYEKAIHARVPDVPIVGPGAFDAPWWRAFAGAGLPQTRALSQHWYPLWSCDGVKEPRALPTVANMVSPWLHDRATFIVGMGITTAAAYGLPLWMEETGPTSCAGTNPTSRTHAQALWTVDFVLHGAALGVERMNQHGMIDPCAGGAPMSPVCDTATSRRQSGRIMGQSNYLALLQVAELRQGAFLPVTSSGSDQVFAYAIEDAAGIDLVLVNLSDPAVAGASPVSLTTPPGSTVTEASLLYAASLEAVNETVLIPWSPVAGQTAWSVPAGSVLALRLAKA